MRRFPRLAWALCASVAVSACSSEGTDPAGGGILKPPVTTGVILGTLELEGLGACAGVAVDIDGPSGLQEIVTAGGGTFRVEGLSAGAYAVRARAEGYTAIEEVFVYDAVEPRDVGTVALAIERVPVRGRVKTSDGRSAAGASVAVSAEANLAPPAGITCGDDVDASALGGTTALVGPDGQWATEMPAIAAKLKGLVQREGYTEEPFEVAGEVLTAAAAAGEPADAGEVTLYPLTGFVNAVGGKYQNALSVDLQVSAFNGAGELRLGSEIDGVCDYTGADWAAFDATPTFTATADGEITICVGVRNDRGQAIELTTDVVVDTTAPSAVQATIGSGGPYVRTNTVNVAVSAVESGSGLATVRIVDNGVSSGDLPYGSVVAHTFGGAGLRTLEVFVTDRAGNESAAATATVTLDADAPTFAASRTWSGRTVTVSLTSIVDASPLEVRFGWNGPGANDLPIATAGWQALPAATATTVTVLLPAVDGAYDVQVQLRDAAGNLSATETLATVTVDENLPTNLSFDIRESASTSLTVNLDVSAVDTSAVRLEVSPSLGFASPTVYNAVGNPSSYTYTFSAGPDGERTLYARFCDAANNCAGPYSDSVRIDTQAPTSPYAAVRSGAWATQAAITLDLFAAGADYVAYAQGTSAFTFPADFVSSAYAPEKPLVLTGGDGVKTIWVVFADQAGWMTTPVSATVALDTAAPSTPTVTLAGGATATGERLVEVALSGYTPESGLEMRIAENPSFTGAVWQPAASVFTHTLSAGDGAKTVYAQLRDPAGNTSGVGNDGISIDTTPPSGATLAIVGNPSAISSTTVSLTLNATGASTIELATNSAFTGASTIVYTTSASHTLTTGDGLKTVYARYCDDAGNCSAAASVSVVLDTVAPSGGLLINNGAASTTNRSATLTISASDTGSGIAGMRLQNDTATGIGGTSLLAFEPSRAWTLSGAGAETATKTVYLQLVDAAGNTSTVASDSIDLDNEGPTLTSVTIASGASITSTRSVSVSLVATGADEMLVSQDAAFAGATWRSYASTFDWSLEGADGTKTLYVRLKDSAGNFSSTSGDTIDLDTTPPTLSAVAIDGGAAWSQDLDVSVASTTSGSPTTMRISEGATVLYNGAFAATTSVTLAAGEGARTLTVRVWDAVGLASDSVFDTISVDTEAPSGLAASVQEGSFTTSPNVTVLLSASGADQVAIQESSDFSGATWGAYATQKAFVLSGGDGLKTIYVQVRDAAGWTNGPVSVDVTLDESGPTPGATPIVINGGDSGTSVRTVTLAIDAGDADEMQVSESASFAGASWEAAASSRAFELSPGDGVKTVYVRFRDTAGNATGSYNDTISLDTTPPTGATIAIVGNPSAVSSTSVSLTLGATGAATIELANNSAFTGASTIVYTTSASHTLTTGDGLKTVYARYCDDAGNCSAAASVSVVLDTVAPSGGLLINNGAASTTNRSATLTISASDTGSGIAGMRLQNDTATGIGATSLLAFEPSRVWTLSGAGAETATKTVYLQLVDAAGNTSTVASDSISLDNESPVLSAVSVNGGVSPTNQRTLTVALTTSGSPTEMRVSEDAAFAGATWTVYAASFSHTFSSTDGAKTLYVQVRDGSGNTSSTESGTVTIDTTGPSLTVAQINGGAAYASSLNVTVTTAAGGSPSRLVITEGASTLFDGAYSASETLTLAAGEGPRALGIRVYDALDNASDLRTATITIDSAKPTGSIAINGGAATTSNRTVTLNLSGADGGSGLAGIKLANTSGALATTSVVAFEATKVWTLSGTGAESATKTVYLQLVDGAGNVSAVYSDSIALDNEGPTLTSVTIAAGASITSTRSVSVSLVATGADEMLVSQDAAFAGATWRSYAGTFDWSLEGADGTKTLYVRLKDSAGNFSSTSGDTIDLDTTPPTLSSVVIDGGAAWSQDLDVSVASTTSGSPATMRISEGATVLYNGAFAATTSVTLAAGEGARTLTVRVWDAVGLASDSVFDTISVDTEAPSGLAASVQEGSFTTSPNVTVLLSASGADQVAIQESADFSGATWSAYATQKAFVLSGGDGLKTIYVQVRDAAGWTNGPVSVDVTLDESGPTPGATPIVINGGDSGTSVRTVTLTIDAGDADEMQVSESASFAGASWEAAASSRAFELSPGDGVKTVYVRFRDTAGNTTGSYNDTISLDTTPPTGATLAIVGNPSAVSSTTVSLTLGATGASTVELANNLAFTSASTFAYTTATSTTLSSGDGVKNLYARFCDDAANCTAGVGVSVVLDQTAPVGAIAINGGAASTTSRSATLTLSASDAGSGIAGMRLQNDTATGIGATSLLAFEPNRAWTLSGAGAETATKSVHYVLVDAAGNTSTVYADSIALDNEAPVLSAVAVNGGTTPTNNRTLTVALTTSGSPTEMRVSEDAAFAGATWTGFAASFQHSFSSGDGLKTLYIQVRDAAGNASSTESGSITIDTTGPSLTVAQINGGAAYASSLDVTVTTTAGGSPSRLVITEGASTLFDGAYSASETLTLAAGEGPRSLGIRVYDALDNASDLRTASIVVDTVKPTGAVLIAAGADRVAGESVTLNLAANDGGSGVKQLYLADSQAGLATTTATSYDQTKAWTLAAVAGGSAASRTVWLQVEDKAGNRSSAVSDSITVDKELPTGSISLSAAVTNDTLIGVDLTFAGDTATMKLSSGNACAGGNWVGVADATLWSLAAVDGTQHVSVRFRDAVGNESACYSDSVDLDRTGPSPTSLTLAGSGTPQPGYSDSADVTATFATAAADCATAEFSEDVGFLVITDTHAVCSDSLPYTFASAGDGTKSLYLRYVDTLGNVGPLASATIVVDSADPQVGVGGAFTIAEGEFVGDAAITLQMNAVGATRMRVAQDTVCSGSLETYSSTRPWTLTGGDGPWTVAVRFEDEAGNASDCYTQDVTLDTAAPTFAASLAGAEGVGGRTARQVVTLSLSGVSADAVEMMAANLAGFPGTAWQPVTDAQSWVLDPADGGKSVYVKIRDRAGNESPVVAPSITLDATPPPTPTLQVIDINSDGFALADDEVELSWSASVDPNLQGYVLERLVSGVDSAFIQIGSPTATPPLTWVDSAVSPGSTHSYRIRALDDLGLTSGDSNIAQALPFSPITKAAWFRRGDDVEVQFPGNAGTFSLQPYYRYYDLSLLVDTMSPLAPNQPRATRVTPNDRIWAEEVVVRAANQDNSLVYESTVKLPHNRIEPLPGATSTSAGNVFADGVRRVVTISSNALHLLEDKGGGWQSTPTGLTVSFTNRICRHLHQDEAGALHVAYTSGSTVYYATNASGSWVATNLGTYTNTECTLILDKAGKAHLAVRYNAGANSYVYYFTNAGGSWAGETAGYWPTWTGRLDLAVTSGGIPYILHAPKIARKVSGSWIVDETWSTGMWLQSTVMALAEHTDRPVVAFYDSTSSSYYSMVSQGASWAVTGSVVQNLWPKEIRSYDHDGEALVEVLAWENPGGGIRLIRHGFGYSEALLSKGAVNGDYANFYWDRVGRIHALRFPPSSPQYGIMSESPAALPWRDEPIAFAPAVNPPTLVFGNGRVVNMSTTGGLGAQERATDGVWTSTAIDTTPGLVVADLDAVASPAGDVHVLYSAYYNYDLKYARKLAGGSWTVQNIITTGDTGFYPRLAMDSLGSLHGSFLEIGTGMRYLTNRTGTWTYVLIDSTNYAFQQAGDLWVDSASNVHVVYRRWISGSVYDMRYKRKSRTATSWAVDQSIDAATSQMGNTAGFMNPDGVPAVVYSDAGIRYRWRGATAWSDANEEMIDPSGHSVQSVHVDRRGRIWVSYNRTDGAYAAVRDPDGKWWTSRTNRLFRMDAFDWAHGFFSPSTGSWRYWLGQPGDVLTLAAPSRVSAN